MATITFVRHGNTGWNVEKRAQGFSNNPLNSTGRAQARLVAARLAQGQWDLIISSDLLRARETAEIIADYIEKPVDFFDERIREIGRGEIEGTIEEERIQIWGKDWRNLELGLESKESLTKRGVEFVEDMANRYAGKSLLVISHGLLILHTLKELLGDKIADEKLKNTSVSVIKYNGQSWENQLYNCIQHLDSKASLKDG